MNKRMVLICAVGVVILLIVFVPSLMALFFFPKYRVIAQGLMFLFVGGFNVWVGIKLLPAAKIRGASIPWWKHYLIILGLMFGGFGVLDLILELNQVNDVLGSGIGTFFGILFVLFILALGIYGISLAWQQIAINRRPEQPL